MRNAPRFSPAIHGDLVRDAPAGAAPGAKEVNIDHPLILLPPSRRLDNEVAARRCMDLLAEYPPGEESDDFWDDLEASQG